MKVQKIIIMFFAVFLTSLLFSCGGADINNKAPLSGSTLTHPADWASVSAYQAKSINFHGIFVDKNGDGSCAQCHGSDYKGGITGISCYQCHNGGTSGKHTPEWINPKFDIPPVSDQFHGIFVNENGTNSCIQCHGSDLSGGVAQVSCISCHNGPTGLWGHPEGWTTGKNDPLHFHGYYAKKYSLACTACHGADLKGALGTSCYSCHGKLW